MTDGGTTPSATESMIFEQTPSGVLVPSSAMGPPSASASVSDEERSKYEQERVELYRQLDEKVDGILFETGKFVEFIF